MGVYMNGGTQNRWFTRETPIAMDDLGVRLCEETSRWSHEGPLDEFSVTLPRDIGSDPSGGPAR